MNNKLPRTISQIRGNHESGIKIAINIHKYLEQAVDYLVKAKEIYINPIIRAAYIAASDDLLKTVVLHCACVRKEIHIAYAPHLSRD